MIEIYILFKIGSEVYKYVIYKNNDKIVKKFF